jgi:hypothetical protein
MTSRSLAKPQNPRADRAAATTPKRRPRALNVRALSEAGDETVHYDVPVPQAAVEETPAPAGAPGETIAYNGYLLKVEPQRRGWKATIFPPKSHFALHRIAYTSDETGRDRVIAEAKAIVDAELPAPAPAAEPAAPDAARATQGFALGEMLPRFEIAAPLRRLRTAFAQACTRVMKAAKRIYFSIDSR